MFLEGESAKTQSGTDSGTYRGSGTTATGTGSTGLAKSGFLPFFSPTMLPRQTHTKPENLSTTLQSSDLDASGEVTVLLQI